ncbi:MULTISPECIES: glycosyltransferase family 2 protein [unclassified Phaeobacter]|uniref:glycosyltransferase family 2 protein n=1 Tax=unclassified Phaeobacter TaxID=2621772 RepID=UPI003A89A12F
MQEPAGQGRMISIIMANHQGAPYLPDALRSVASQTHADWELIVADDGSSDGSVDILREVARQDPRVRVLQHETPSGPAAARNRALAAARGDWLAICDSDDIMHPDRLRRLLAAAEALDADAVADDMVHFATELLAGPRSVLGSDAPEVPRQIGPADMLRVPEPGTSGAQLGYLKPLIRRQALAALRYDEALTIGEDQDFYLRLLLQGTRMWLLPEALYLYRRHPHSLSHRSTRRQILAALAAMEALPGQLSASQHLELKHIIEERRQVLQDRLAFETLAETLKQRRFGAALRQILRHPALGFRLVQIAWAKMRSIGRGQGGGQAGQAGEAAAERVHLIGPADGLPPQGEGQHVVVPDPGADGGHSSLWADLCYRASRRVLTVTYGDEAGLSAAWRIPAAAHIKARGAVVSDLMPPQGRRDG